MNFATLKAMIENLVKSFACPMCSASIKETNIEIIGAAGSTVNIDIECPTCKKHALIKAELAYADGNNMAATKEKLEMIKDMLKGIGRNHGNTLEATLEPKLLSESIDDKQIVELSQNLKHKNMSVGELLQEEEDK